MGWFLADAVPGGRSLAAIASMGAALIGIGAVAMREPPPPPDLASHGWVTHCGIPAAERRALLDQMNQYYLDLNARGDALVRRAHEVAALTLAEHPELSIHAAASRGPTGRWLSIELEPFQLLGARLDCAAVVTVSAGPHETPFRRSARVTLDARADARARGIARDACITAAVEAATEAALASE